MKILIRLIIFLSLTGCGNQGWIIANIPLDQETNTNTVFIEIVDSDSVIHWYHGRIYEESNYCYKHQHYEDVKIK
tara:strand:+ start:295 stop:519 length:225 start_codon:yes stop_codon:yes gene_type:complete